MFCTKCGYNIGIAKNFCPECGEKIVVASNSDVISSEVNATHYSNVIKPPVIIAAEDKLAKQRMKKGLKLLVLIILIPFLLVSRIGARGVWCARLINWYNQDT